MRTYILFLVIVAHLEACGGDDGTQVCGADHCGLQGHTVVKWTFDAYPEWMFPMDSCVDFTVGKVRVDAQDSLGGVTTAVDDCGAAQVTFDGLPDGDYTMFVDPQDFVGNSLVTTPTTITMPAGVYGADTTATANVPWTSWTGTFTGTFLFRMTWNGQSCSAASPAVVTQVLTLMVGGVPLAVSADNGQKLDGTDPKSCYETTQSFPQSVVNVPFGPAQLKIDGYSAASTTTPAFTKTFDIFLGAGITNPTITYDVPQAI